MEQEYIITVFSENKVGLLSQITTVFTCRNVNIESLTTSESALAGIHKFTIVVRTGPDRVEKLARQVEKKIDVLKVFVYTSDEVVQQEIALYKVTRSRNVEKLVREHNVRILEIDDDYIVVEKPAIRQRRRHCSACCNPSACNSSCAAARWPSSNRGASCSTNTSKNSRGTDKERIHFNF